jgi:hypothetical protein
MSCGRVGTYFCFLFVVEFAYASERCSDVTFASVQSGLFVADDEELWLRCCRGFD